MNQAMRKRLKAQREGCAEPPRVRFLFLEAGETIADFEEQRQRLIAEGKASATDRFIPFCWK